MKILIINWQDIKNPLSGGAEVHLHEIFSRIVAMGHEVTLLCSEYESCLKEEFIGGIKVIRKGKRNTFNFLARKLYKRVYSNLDFDIVIDDINKIPFYTPLFVKKPLLAISHHFFGTSIYRETNPIAGTYVIISEKFVDRIYKQTPFAVVSKSTLDEFLSRGFKRNNFTIVPNAIEHKAFPMKVSEKSEKPVITYFGRLKKYKSVDHLVRAFAIVKKELSDAELWIMGRGDYSDKLKSLTEKLGIADAATFFGFVTEEQKIDLLSRSHVMVNTSLKEGWGITNIEANACGTPVISSNVPGLRDSVKDGQSGQLYEYGNIVELADKLINYLSDSELQNKLSHGAVDWASQFSWDNSAKIMIELCEKVISDYKA